MKVENYDTVVKLMATMKKHQEKLEDISEHDIRINIIDRGGQSIYTIGVSGNSEHEYAKIGKELVDKIKEDLKNRIDWHKGAIEKL